MTERALLDRIALTDLVMRYCRGIDRRDYALVRSLYHDDAIDDHGNMFCGSPDDFVESLNNDLQGHSAYPLEIESFLDPDWTGLREFHQMRHA